MRPYPISLLAKASLFVRSMSMEALSVAGVAAVGIKAESRRRWHPIIQYEDEMTTRQITSDARLPPIYEAQHGHAAWAHQRGLVEGQGAWRVNRQRKEKLHRPSLSGRVIAELDAGNSISCACAVFYFCEAGFA
jgi:hypothetical protein